MSARCKHSKYSLHIDSVMEFYYLLYLFVLTDFAAEALLRVEREATCPPITNFSGRVKYRRRGTRAVFRCPKKFDRYGPKFATCQDDGTWSNEPPLCTKTGCLPLDQNLVSNLIMDVVNQAVVKFSCDQNYHLLGETLAYCDGKDWSAPLPRCAALHELTECDFEEGLCGWTQDDSDEQDWIRTLGPTPTGNTGPKYDHTYGDTGNVEGEANCPNITNFSGEVKYKRRGTKAVFKCPKKFDRYGPRRAICQDDGTWSKQPPLCTKTGCLPLDQNMVSNLTMDLVNEAVVGFSCDQDYHLIGETLAYCNGTDWSAPLPRCAALHELTECDFEDDLCGWTQDDSDEQDWIRTLGPIPTGNTGPKYDHTYGDTGNGHFLFFETSNPTMTSNEAILYSPVYNESLSPMCFDFWYHILGPNEAGHVGSLKVFVSDESQYSDVDDNLPLFVKEGNQRDKWQRGDIFIDSQVESYQIIIVATRALNYTIDIAIDDVRLYNCSRKNETGQATIMAQTSTTPTHLITKSTTTMTQTTRGIKSSTSKLPTTEFTTITTQTLTTPRFFTAMSVTTASQTSATPNRSETESTTETTQTSTTPRPFTKESTTFTTQTSATQRFSTAKSIATASQTLTTPNRSRTGSTTTTTQTSSTPRPSSTSSLNKFSLSSKDKTSSKMRPSTSKTDLPTKTSSTSSTMLTSVCCISSSTSSSSTLIATRKDLSTTRQASTDYMNDITGKEKVISISQNTNTEKTQTSTSGTTHVSKPTKRTNAVTTKQSIISKKTRGNSISVSNERSEDIENEILTSLVIGLCVGMVAGSIIIFVIACVCVRRRKFITNSYEGELKQMKNSDSV